MDGNGCTGTTPGFQSSVRINVGPNAINGGARRMMMMFQSSVRINVGPNTEKRVVCRMRDGVSILRED